MIVVYLCRYASLYFCMCIDEADNELEVLEIIHHYVEILDRYFGSVSKRISKKFFCQLTKKHLDIDLELFILWSTGLWTRFDFQLPQGMHRHNSESILSEKQWFYYTLYSYFY